MNLHTVLATRNPCFRASVPLFPAGLMLHSTGADNPNLRRYVGPDDGLLGFNPNGNYMNNPGATTCVHGFIGKLADGSIATYQILPWDMRAWHCGRGKYGSANDTHIGIEICEDGLEDASYFKAVYREAVELFAYLCKKFNLDPLAPGVILCHSEGRDLGIASNHSDVMHWFPKHGKTMDDFRADVALEMEDNVTQEQFDTLMDNYLVRRGLMKPEAIWQVEGLARVKAAGITDGSRPLAFCTRLEAAMMAQKAAEG